MTKRFVSLISAAILGSAITIGLLYAFGFHKQQIVVKHDDKAQAQQVNYRINDSGSIHFSNDFTVAAERTMTAVVHIKSTQIESVNRVYRRINPFWHFFGDEYYYYQQPEQQARVSTGSGVIVHSDGYIVTNNHVINNASDIEVSFYDNRSYKAKVVGTDPSTDLALLKIEEEGLTAMRIANSDAVRVGDWVLAVGNPFNLTSTATAGIVSAKGRNIHILKEKSAIESFIQTDAAVNPGNSGGALVNIQGELIGINSAIASPTGAYAGYSFAIPSNIVKKVVDDLMEYGVVQRGYLGIQISPMNATLAREQDLDVTEGVYVESITEDGSAANAGIKPGDVIISIENKKIRTKAELLEIVGRHSPGDRLQLLINRKGKNIETKVILKNEQGDTKIVKKQPRDVLKNLGAEFRELTNKEVKKYGLDGVVVEKLYPGKMVEQTRIQENFVIIAVNGKKVTSVDEFITALNKYRKGGIMVEGFYPGYSGIYYYGFGL